MIGHGTEKNILKLRLFEIFEQGNYNSNFWSRYSS